MVLDREIQCGTVQYTGTGTVPDTRTGTVESVAVFVRVCVVGFGWMVVRFVRVIRAVFVRVCVRVGLGGWL